MIPQRTIAEWHKNVAWSTQDMIERDIVISKALISLYSNPIIQEKLIFRGGTALNKLHINPPSRYSEDIDFVQRHPEPVGQLINAIRSCLDSWLDEPQRRITEYGIKLTYRYRATNGHPMKLKVEINPTEFFNALELDYRVYSIDSSWFKGSAVITTYQLEELMATKIRALFQRRKGRDLYDLWHVFSQDQVNIEKAVTLFQLYCSRGGTPISRKVFLENMEQKRLHRGFREDMQRLLPYGTKWNFDDAYEFVIKHVITKIP